MSWSAGVFTRTNGVYSGDDVWNSDKGAGVKIITSRHDYHDEDIANGINTCLTKDGTNTATANLPMGGFRHTNPGVAAAYTDYARASQVQDGSLIYGGTTGGTTTAYTLTPGVVLNSRVVGMRVRAVINATNTGVATLNVSGTGAANIVSVSGSQCPTGTLLINKRYEFEWDGTNWIVVSPVYTAWTNYTPTYTGNGSLTYGTVTTDVGRWRYNFNSHSIDVQIRASGTTGGVVSTGILVTFPFTASGTGLFYPACNADSGSAIPAPMFLTTTTQLEFRTATNANWSLGAGRFISGTATIPLA